MMLMIEDYFVVVDYFDEKESREKAIEAANRLAKVAKRISDLSHRRMRIRPTSMSISKTSLVKPFFNFAEKLEQEGISGRNP